MDVESVAHVAKGVQYGQVDLGLLEPVFQLVDGGLGDRDLHAGEIRLELRQEPRQPHWPDRGHHAQPDGHLVEQPEVVGEHARGGRFLQDVFEMGQQRAPEVAQQDTLALAMEELRAEFGLDRADGFRERRLRHVAFGGRLGEVQMLCRRLDVPDLEHLHHCLLRAMARESSS